MQKPIAPIPLPWVNGCDASQSAPFVSSVEARFWSSAIIAFWASSGSSATFP
jgi:hypothetical protein